MENQHDLVVDLAEENGFEKLVSVVITQYAVNCQGELVGIVEQEVQMCKLLSQGKRETVTVSVPEKGLAISLLVEDFGDILRAAQ